MGDNSKIEWTQATWNIVTGCSKVSPGCAHCYAEREWSRLAGNTKTVYHGRQFTDVRCHPERLEQPLLWKKPRMIFVNSMSDLFHLDVPFEFIAEVYKIIKRCPQHTFQILTKRPDRALEFYEWDIKTNGFHPGFYGWLKNVWFMVTVENQEMANDRIPKLLRIPAHTRGISAEPLLSEISLTGLIPPIGTRFKCSFCGEYTKYYSLHCQTCGKEGGYSGSFAKLDWVICGGESGPKARPMHPHWVRDLWNQCQNAGVPFFFKQWGEWQQVGLCMTEPDDRKFYNKSEVQIVNHEGGQGYHGNGAVYMQRVGKKKAGRELDGRTWDEFPQIQP